MVLLTRGGSGRFLVMNLVYSATLVGLMFLGGQWGAIGIASARAVTLVLVVPWALHYCLADTPVSVGDFVRTLSRPAVASLTMAGTLFALRYFLPLESASLSLAVGCGTAIAVYFLTFSLLPGGRAQLYSLPNEFLAALRKRSSKGV